MYYDKDALHLHLDSLATLTLIPSSSEALKCIKVVFQESKALMSYKSPSLTFKAVDLSDVVLEPVAGRESQPSPALTAISDLRGRLSITPDVANAQDGSGHPGTDTDVDNHGTTGESAGADVGNHDHTGSNVDIEVGIDIGNHANVGDGDGIEGGTDAPQGGHQSSWTPINQQEAPEAPLPGSELPVPDTSFSLPDPQLPLPTQPGQFVRPPRPVRPQLLEATSSSIDKMRAAAKTLKRKKTNAETPAPDKVRSTKVPRVFETLFGSVASHTSGYSEDKLSDALLNIGAQTDTFFDALIKRIDERDALRAKEHQSIASAASVITKVNSDVEALREQVSALKQVPLERSNEEIDKVIANFDLLSPSMNKLDGINQSMGIQHHLDSATIGESLVSYLTKTSDSETLQQLIKSSKGLPIGDTTNIRTRLRVSEQELAHRLITFANDS